jgi:ACS family glucarate transporter-like MFS transporter
VKENVSESGGTEQGRECTPTTLSPCHLVTLSPCQPKRGRYLVLAAACSLAVLTYVQRQGFVAAVPSIARDLALDNAQVGYLASVWLVAYGLFQVPGGMLGDRLGARHLLTILVLSWSLVAGAVALTAQLPPGGWLVFAVLLVLRFLFGALQAGGFPGLARVIADWIPARERGSAQGMVWTFSRLGGFLAPLLVLWLFRAFGDWPIPLWLLAGLGAVWCAFFWPWFRNRPQEREGESPVESETRFQPPAEGERGSTSISRSRDCGIVEQVPNTLDLPESDRPLTLPQRLPLSRLVGSKNVWGLCFMYGFVGFGGNFITSLLPLYLKDHRRLSDDATAWISGLPLACGIVSCLLGGVLSDWIIRRTGSRIWGRRLVGGIALLLAACSCLLVLWSREVWLLAVAFSAWFFFSDATMGPAWASCADVGEQHAGALSGAMNMTGAFLGAVGMGLAGWFLNRGLGDVVFVLFAGSYVLAALCWLAVDVTRPLVSAEIASRGEE